MERCSKNTSGSQWKSGLTPVKVRPGSATGCSSIEIDFVVHEFIIGDKLHPQNREIYRMLEEMNVYWGEACFVSDNSEVLLEMEEEWKEGALRHHSEKLAILTVVKNLSMCRNCHEATKLMSKIYKMEIVARERTRFHHFCNIPSCYI
ncbi:pentatricopeptide repeat-containing protein At1g08070, chloroplastic-like [Brassica napus]|nr:pentatricopeptide repeat-containing protein At1g08070, chloroplastic-like [Brassica napus]